MDATKDARITRASERLDRIEVLLEQCEKRVAELVDPATGDIASPAAESDDQ